jgi:hypothetical protein
MLDTTSLRISTISDFFQAIRTYPVLRRELLEILEIDTSYKELRQALEALAETQRRTEEILQRADHDRQAIRDRMEAGFAEERAEREAGFAKAKAEREAGFAEARAEREAGFAEARAEREAGFAEARADRQAIRDRMEAGFAEARADRQGIKHTLGILKGKTYEREFSDRATGIFGRYIKRGHDVANELSEIVQEAENAGKITENEYDQIYATDLLWGGKLKTTDEDIVLVVEASWLVLETDVERAVSRAEILRKVGLKAVPVVAGVEWADGMSEIALNQQVVMVLDRSIDKSSWSSAIAL